MDANRRTRAADPEFDPSPPLPVRLRDFDPLEHHRLVVNPFLAVFGLIALVPLSRWLLMTRWMLFCLIAGVTILLLPHLIQYHCLDCGRTGLYLRRRNHACPGVMARWREGRRSKWPFPSSRSQMVVWVWVIGSAAILAAVLGLGD